MSNPLLAVAGVIATSRAQENFNAYNEENRCIFDVAKSVLEGGDGHVFGRVRSLFNETTIKTNNDTEIEVGQWIMIIGLTNSTVEFNTRQIIRDSLPIYRVSIPSEWVCRHCHASNDNFLSNSRNCRRCEAFIDGVTDVGSDFMTQVIRLVLADPTQDVMNLSFSVSENDRRRTSNSDGDTVMEEEKAKPGHVLCDICCDLRATQLLRCCDSGKNVCDRCPLKSVLSTGDIHCPFCKKIMRFTTHCRVVEPEGTMCVDEEEAEA